MSQLSQNELLPKLRYRYKNAKSKLRKSQILDELCQDWGYDRKYAIKLLNQRKLKAKKKAGRKPIYDEKVTTVLKMIWLKANQPCSKRMLSVIPLWLPSYEKHYQTLDEEVRHKLLNISAATIDRLLKPARAQEQRKKNTGTKPCKILRTKIPIRCESWDVSEPGFMECDTVAHCGGLMSGDFIWSLSCTDILTGWTENRCVYNKGAHGVLEQIIDIEEKLPFELKGFDCDNGTEFINHHLYNHFTDRPRKISFTRSRPYKKNDQAHVEQKNWTHVREWLGYERIDDPDLVIGINHFYALANTWQNYFQPCMKLVEKERIKSRYKKKYDKAQTPFERLKNSGKLAKSKVEEMEQEFKTLDPFELRKQMDRQLSKVFIKLKKYQSGNAA